MQWFRQQQRRSGITAETIGDALGRDRSVVSRIYNGHQRMTLDQAKVFAQVLKVPLADVLAHAGLADAETAQQFEPGFSGSDVARFAPTDPGAAGIMEMARFLGGERAGKDVWRVKGRSMVLDGYVDGDFILVDHTSFDRARTGDVVIAQVYDWQTGSAVTLLRRYQPPVLTAASADPEDRKIHVVDGSNVAIKGVVVASWRGGHLN